MAIDAELKTRWVEALRSRKYKQAKYVLKNTSADRSGYCCLGVLCDLIDPDGWKGTYECYASWKAFTTITTIPSRTVKGLTQPVQTKLAQMNDDGKTFKEIASYIEENL